MASAQIRSAFGASVTGCRIAQPVSTSPASRFSVDSSAAQPRDQHRYPQPQHHDQQQPRHGHAPRCARPATVREATGAGRCLYDHATVADRVRITDVAPRDGLQNEPEPVPTAAKLRLIELVSASGVDEVEVTSFVSPAWVPQLADAAGLCDMMAASAALAGSRPVLSALVPNVRGMESALAANQRAIDRVGRRVIDKIALFTAASETFSQRNTNTSIEGTLQRFEPVVAMAQEEGLAIRGYISCAIACPFEGPTPPQRVADLAARLVALGVGDIDLADTIGAGEPESVVAMITAVLDQLGRDSVDRFTLHLHDTHQRAVDCALAAVRLGVRSFDAAAGGLGGCPFASVPGRRAPGNVDGVALVRALHGAGYRSGVDVDRLVEAARFARTLIGGARCAEGDAP